MKHISSFIIMFFLTTNFVFGQSDIFPRKEYQIEVLKVIDINFNEQAIFPNSTSIVRTSTKNVYRYDDLAVFCKIEVKMEKASGFPVKFRLGEVNYVEKMEGKPYSIFY